MERPTLNDVPPVDLEEFRSSMRAAGIEDIVDPMLALFMQEAPKGMATLVATVGSRDLEGARRAAHALKSSAGNIRAKELADLLQQLETAAQEGSMDVALATFGSVQRAYKAVIDYLTKV
jgi:HPt (histidine-containing phosphotransfer) domain-containing protein